MKVHTITECAMKVHTICMNFTKCAMKVHTIIMLYDLYEPYQVRHEGSYDNQVMKVHTICMNLTKCAMKVHTITKCNVVHTICMNLTKCAISTGGRLVGNTVVCNLQPTRLMAMIDFWTASLEDIHAHMATTEYASLSRPSACGHCDRCVRHSPHRHVHYWERQQQFRESGTRHHGPQAVL